MRASVERRRAEARKKQERLEELGGILGAIFCGIALGLPFVIYSLLY